MTSETRLALPRIAVDSGRAARLAIHGRSMLPMVREPMTVAVVPLRGRARVGDLLVFRSGDVYVAHRVVRRWAAGYVTSGDGQPEVLERVAAADVLGRVASIWSDPSPDAVRVDTALHRARGLLYARARLARLAVRRLAGRLARLHRPKGT